MAATLHEPQCSNPSPHTSNKSSLPRKDKGKRKEMPRANPKRRVGPQTAPSNSSNSDRTWNWISLTDASSRKFPPIFTRDGNYFFSLVSSSVRIHATASGEVVSTLTAPRNAVSSDSKTDTLTCAVLNPHNAFQLITGSLDGCLRIWDYLEGTLLRTVDLSQPILHLCVHERFRDAAFVAVSRADPSKAESDKNAIILKVSLDSKSETNSSSSKQSDKTPIGKTRLPSGFALSPSGQYLVVVAGHKVYAARTASLKAGFTKYVSPERLTCLALHPSDDYFATGDKKGAIRLWYCLNDDVGIPTSGVEKKAQTTTMHWHSHAVSSLSFTSNGSYLLSGGEESVLVVWQLDTGKKEFVPRLGAPVKTITVAKPVASGEEEYLLELDDATFVFISSMSMKFARTFSRLKLSGDQPQPSSSKQQLSPLAAHQLTSTLILPSSHPSSLQIYSPSSSKLLSELEVTPSNRVSRRDDAPLQQSIVENVTISPSGSWMATVDVRHHDDSVRAEIHLKIWFWDAKFQQWKLNSRIDEPHGVQSITDVVFSPSSNELATTGEDEKVRTWRFRPSKRKGEDGFWVARSSVSCGFEHPKSACWSPDSSLLSVCTDQHVMLYDPATVSVIQVLTTPECKLIRCSAFIGSGGRFFAVAGSKNVVMWDLLSRSVRWHHSIANPIDRLVSHPSANSFVVMSRDMERQESHVSVFAPSSPSVLSAHVLPFALKAVIWYPYSASTSSYNFAGITHDSATVLFGDDIESRAEAKANAISTWAPHKRSLFQDVFGHSAFSDTPATNAAASKTIDSGSGPRHTVFDHPSHSMPSIESLFDDILPALVKQLPAEENDHEPVNPDLLAMEVDAPEELVVTSSRVKKRVEESELKALTKLFKLHAIQPRQIGASSNLKRQKVQSTPGTPVHGINGVNGKPPLSKQVRSEPSDIDEPEASPQLVNGKKRKNPINS